MVMYRLLLFLFAWAAVGWMFSLMAGLKNGFWWWVTLGMPASLIGGGLALGFIVAVFGAFIGFVTPRRR